MRHGAPIHTRPKQILFVLGAGYLPGVIGAANLSLHALCLRLRGLGHEPIVVCAPGPAPAPGWPVPDYPVIRVDEPLETMKEMVAALAPYAVVLRGPWPAFGALRWAAATGGALHAYFTTVSFECSFPAPADTRGLRLAANSPFLASSVRALVGRPAVWLPTLVEPEACRCEPRGDAILFAHPTPARGAHLAAAIAARLPHRRFLFARMPHGSGGDAEIDVDLPNVEAVGATGDPRPLLERTRLLLMPSMHEEAWGRTVTEAQVSGIPALAADRGGLAANVGKAGGVLPLGASAERWCAEIEDLLGDDARYRAASSAAFAQASRPELAPENVVARFLEFVAS